MSISLWGRPPNPSKESLVLILVSNFQNCLGWSGVVRHWMVLGKYQSGGVVEERLRESRSKINFGVRRSTREESFAGEIERILE